MEQKNCNQCINTNRTTKRSEEEKEKLIKRLNIIEGQVRGVKQMILDDRYCDTEEVSKEIMDLFKKLR